MSLGRLVQIEDRWDRLVEAARRHPRGNEMLDMIEAVDLQVREDIVRQEQRFAAYWPERPADEPHDSRCQVVRYGKGNACTCHSNFTRRRAQVANAAAAGDMAFRETLGSMEQQAFDRVVAEKAAARGIKCVACEEGLKTSAETDADGNCPKCGTWVCPF